MEKSNVVKIEDVVPSFLSKITARSNAAKVNKILEAAKERGHITTSEIAQLLPASVMKDRENFSFFVSQLGDYLKKANLELSHKAEVIALVDGQKGEVLKPTGRKVVFRKTTPVVQKENEKRQESEVESFDDEEGSVDTDTSFVSTSAIEIPLNEDEQKELNSLYIDDPLEQYYRDVAQFRQLTQQEVNELSRRIREECDLDARNELVCHNLRLVRWVARRYVWSEVPFSDLLQEGNIGLLTAAERYDATLGYSFTTYAHWWIRQGMQRAIQNQSDVIRVPVYLRELRTKVLRAIEEIARETRRIPGAKMIAAHLGLSEDKVQSALMAMRLLSPHSLDEKAGSHSSKNEDDFGTYGDHVPDVAAVDPALNIETKEELVAACRELQTVLKAVEALPGDKKRNMTVFREMHGINDAGERLTLRKVGEQLGVSGESVRQVLVSIFLQLSRQGIEVDSKALRDHVWRIQELEKLVGSTPEL